MAPTESRRRIECQLPCVFPILHYWQSCRRRSFPCGLAYQAGTRIKATRMSDSLAVGQTSPDIHHEWGEPDIRTYLPGDTEVWSYPYKPNSNDVTAALLYTSSKDGDKGTFLDLKFVGGKLVPWQEAEH